MLKRALAAVVVACSLIGVGCGGSSAEAPLPSTTATESISEADAIDKARAAAQDEGFDVNGLVVKPSKIFGEWQVSFEDERTGVRGGGFLVILEAATGDLVEVVPYR